MDPVGERSKTRLSFAQRLALLLAALLCGFGAVVGLVGHQALKHREQETLQRLSFGLANHIVEHWPAVSRSVGGLDDKLALDKVLDMLMVVNPAIEVYVLDATGYVKAYLGDPKSVVQPQIGLGPVRAFLSGAALPILGSDPKGNLGGKTFSAAVFPSADPLAPPQGYLYVVLEGQALESVGSSVGTQGAWGRATVVLTGALLLTLWIGIRLVRRMASPLRLIARRMQDFSPAVEASSVVSKRVGPWQGDEIEAISASYEAMATRIRQQMAAQVKQQALHLEVVANVAHDLRTPLTALHGHLEALERQLDAAGPSPDSSRPPPLRHLSIALSQSEKVRRLSQQLFELASLQSIDHVVHVERFRIDELVTDAVQKFSYKTDLPRISLEGVSPGAVELDGDLQLIERAVGNLLENALKHAQSSEPVRVRVQRDAGFVSVLIEDQGPGLPVELSRRINSGQPLRDPPLVRSGGGFGGLGLAIVQRIAALHGGSLRAIQRVGGGTSFCLALPIAEKFAT